MKASHWVLSLGREDLPPAIRHQLKRCILDGIGAAIAGTRTRTARIAAEFGAEMGAGGPATVLASGDRLTVALAALANGVAANALDVDDGYRPVKGHPGAFIILPAIGACEERGAHDLLSAIAAGYEIATRAAVATHRHYRHYHASGSWGPLGTAACVGRIIGLNAEQMGWAFGLAEYHAALSPIERCLSQPAMTKDGIGWGAFAGACAAYMASKGFTGNPSLLDDPSNDDLMSDLGANWRVLDLYFKPYTCCRWAQPAVDGALALKRQHGFRHQDVKRVVVHTFREACGLQMTLPANTEEAQYNLAWPVAAALAHGEVGPMQIEDAGLGDDATRRIAALVETSVEQEIQARFPDEALARVEIELTVGPVLKGELMSARGDAHTPLSEQEIVGKFLGLAKPVIGDDAHGLVEAVAELEQPGGEQRLVETLGKLFRTCT